MAQARKSSAEKRLVIVTGMSGSGKGSAAEALEDLGFFCADNLPVDLIPTFAELCRQAGSKISKAALVIDIRGGEALEQFPALFKLLGKGRLKPMLIFLEASNECIRRRFSETRRPHPLGGELPLLEGIRRERKRLRPIRKLADVVIDTTRMNVHELRAMIRSRFLKTKRQKSLLITVQSFGFRFGVPPESDSVFDVRFLPNPNYVRHLKKKTGHDPDVKSYIRSFPRARQSIDRLLGLIAYLLPSYIREGKSYLTISIGCTGGRHRSVAIAEELGTRLEKEGYTCKVVDRDLHK